MNADKNVQKDRFRGLLLGTAVGDALGLPAEGLTAATIQRLGWNNWRYRFFMGKGMVSDDTEHTLFVSQALLDNGNNPVAFQRALAWKLKLWLLGLPAGIGFGTLRAVLKLWIGFSPEKNGVYSAGNGPAMRCAVIGARFAENEERLKVFTKRSTQLTHSDPKALVGALAVSYAAKVAVETQPGNKPDAFTFLDKLVSLTEDDDWQVVVKQIRDGLEAGDSVKNFTGRLGLKKGVSGYIYHTVPVALYSWLKNYGDFAKTLTDVLDCGGDTDTVGAIAGALAGTAVGEQGIPRKWLDGIMEYPRSCKLLREVADRLARQHAGSNEESSVRYFWPSLIGRNLFFVVVVLGHGFLRIVPAAIRKMLIK